jgi:D-sedoheptulose 7-phosphate isomerase
VNIVRLIYKLSAENDVIILAMNSLREDFIEAKNVLDTFITENQNFIALENAGTLMANALQTGNKLIACGNGGSMSDAMHFAEELTGRFRDERPAIAALSISDASHITCTANDYGFDAIFSRFIEAHGRKNDVLLAISTSGNSRNITNACQAAKNAGMRIVALTGKDGGKVAGLCDVEIRVPHFGYSDRIQEIHIKIIHALIRFIENKIKESS